MTRETFVKSVEAYYGNYERRVVRQSVCEYLAAYSEKALDVLFDKLILQISGQYRYTPDVAILDQMRRTLEQEMAEQPAYLTLPEIPQIIESKHETSDGPDREKIAEILAGIRCKFEAAP